jgi:hypothetical protein
MDLIVDQQVSDDELATQLVRLSKQLGRLTVVVETMEADLARRAVPAEAGPRPVPPVDPCVRDGARRLQGLDRRDGPAHPDGAGVVAGTGTPAGRAPGSGRRWPPDRHQTVLTWDRHRARSRPMH